MDACRIELTRDGSPTLYRPDIDEHYHSTYGALSESRYVYIKAALLFKASLTTVRPLRVFEVGLGTGLNAVLAAMTNLEIDYEAIEKYPLNINLISKLNFGNEIDRNILESIHSAQWEKGVTITPTFFIKKRKVDLITHKTEKLFDVIFMDAFAPDKQPEMWSQPVLKHLASLLAPGGVMTTYCAKGHIRRSFQSLGLLPERLPGPPAGKREILRLTKPL